MCPPFLQGVPQLALCLFEETEDHIRGATAWSLGLIGCHTSEHAKTVALSNVLPKLLEFYVDARSSEDLKEKVGAAAAAVQDYGLSRITQRLFCAKYIHIHL